MTSFKILLCSIGSGTLLFVGLMFWYDWKASPLTSQEINAYIAKIEAQTQDPGALHDLPALRAFLETDDGEPVYTVNMYNFHQVADYPEGSQFGSSGEEAFERFSKVMIPLMTQRGSHPVFGSNWVDNGSSNWDRIVIIRYRSRRDLVDLFATDAFADASLHKWASLREHDRMLVEALHIPDGRFPIFILSILASALAFATGQKLFNRR